MEVVRIHRLLITQVILHVVRLQVEVFFPPGFHGREDECMVEVVEEEREVDEEDRQVTTLVEVVVCEEEAVEDRREERVVDDTTEEVAEEDPAEDGDYQ